MKMLICAVLDDRNEEGNETVMNCHELKGLHKQLAELFATSKQSISYHTSNMLKDKELDENSAIKNYLITAIVYK